MGRRTSRRYPRNKRTIGFTLEDLMTSSVGENSPTVTRTIRLIVLYRCIIVRLYYVYGQSSLKFKLGNDPSSLARWLKRPCKRPGIRIAFSVILKSQARWMQNLELKTMRYPFTFILHYQYLIYD